MLFAILAPEGDALMFSLIRKVFLFHLFVWLLAGQGVLAEELAGPIHALAIKADAPMP